MDFVNIYDINLERTVLIKVAGLLWIHEHGIFLNDFKLRNSYWYFLADTCIKSIEKLPLPKKLKEKVKNIIYPVSFEFLQFNRESVKRFGYDRLKNLPVNIVWTVKGTLDIRRTYKALMDEESIDLTLRYSLACYCSLENSIRSLWDQMSKKQKSDIHRDSKCDFELQRIWSLQNRNRNALKKEAIRAGFRSIYEYAFFHSVEEFNKDAVVFFWKKLTLEVRNEVLLDALKSLKDCIVMLRFTYPYHHRCKRSEVILFLLSQADKKSLENIMEHYDYFILSCLLDWPYQEHFLKMLYFDGMLHSLNLCVGTFEHRTLLCKLVNKILNDFQDYDYRLLLKVFLKHGATFSGKNPGPIFPETLNVIPHFPEDPHAVSLITSYCEKVLKKDTCNAYESLSDDEEWDFLTFIIDECILKTNVEIFRKVLDTSTRRIDFKPVNDQLVDKICYFLEYVVRQKIKSLLFEGI